MSSRSSRRSAGSTARTGLNKLRALREGRATRTEQYTVDEDVTIYDTVTEDEYRRIARDKLKSGDSFVIDDDGTGYGDHVMDDWECNDYESDQDDASKSKRSSKKRARENTIVEAFSKAEAKAAKAAPLFKPTIKPEPKPSITSKEETDFMSSLLADLDDDDPIALAKTSISRKKPRLVPSSLLPPEARRPAIKPDPEPVPAPAHDNFDLDLLDHDFSTPRDTQPAVGSRTGDNAMEVTATSDPTQLLPVKPDPLAVEEEQTATPSLEVKKLSTVKPKIKMTKSAPLELPKFPSSALPSPASSSSAPVAGSVNPDALLNEDGSLNMYYIDAAEIRGTVYLFGKVLLPKPAGEDKQEQQQYISCALAVSGIERNVFLLPRERRVINGVPSDVEVQFMDVYTEFDQIRRKLRINKFASKFVDRQYAFEVPGIPLSAQWMKVAYSFADPELPVDLHGETFSHVFGTNTSALELFLLKRKLMGPCWITVSEVTMQAPNFSWCKVEGLVSNPKAVMVPKQQPPPPPLTLMSLTINTAMNPAKSVPEILTITSLTYSVSLDEDSKLVPLQQLVLVRPPTPGMPVPVPPKDATTKVHQSERSMISQFIANLQMQDPDILLGHNIVGYTIDVLMTRFKDLKNHTWSKLGRLRKTQPPKQSMYKTVVQGRLMLDTYLAAKEFVGSSKSYSLSYLCESQLGYTRAEFDVTTVRQQFDHPRTLLSFLHRTTEDCALAVELMNKLCALSLYKQLANTCGALWSRTMIAGRAERNEYLLLHEFHAKKYIVPDKATFGSHSHKGGSHDDDLHQHDDPDHEHDAGAGGNEKSVKGGRKKPQYAGGLVLEPKKGFYDSYVLLLDFNSLYPSIIQEFNICFTTVSRNADEQEDGVPPLPTTTASDTQQPTILPRLIKELVDRRRQVKSLMKNCTPSEYAQYNIRQLALKLTANSMYGCLGFTFSRFYCKPMAALITRQGRTILQNTVDLANANDLPVIYGDTDSIMIHTGTHDLAAVKAMGRKLKELVNKRYRCLEIEMDGFFERMLLLKKKKYAALVVEEIKDGELKRKLEMKGLDLVRRDWCGISHQVSEFVLHQLLMSTAGREAAIQEIHAHLMHVAQQARSGEVPLGLYVINKGLTKRPTEYADGSSQPHVVVALAMLARGEAVHVGETVPYVICKESDPSTENGGESGAQPTTARKAVGIAARAHHPNDLARDSSLSIDVEWYLAQQVLPPVTRLCAVIEGTDQAQLAHCLGLDPRQYQAAASGDSAATDIQPLEALMTDEERYANTESLALRCPTCPNSEPFLMEAPARELDGSVVVGWTCPRCMVPIPKASLVTQVTMAIRAHVRQYTARWAQCDELSCGAKSRALRVYASRCWHHPMCRGKVHLVYPPNQLYRQLRYFAHLFDTHKLIEERHTLLKVTHSEAFAAASQAVQAYLTANERTTVDLATLFSFVRIETTPAAA